MMFRSVGSLLKGQKEGESDADPIGRACRSIEKADPWWTWYTLSNTCMPIPHEQYQLVFPIRSNVRTRHAREPQDQ